MAKDMFWTTVTFAIIIGVLVLAFWPSNKASVIVVKYDCTALQTDTPKEVLEECIKRSTK